MQIERYLKTEELVKSKETKATELNKRKELCKELGLKVQEQLSENTILSPGMFCHRLSDEELKIWTIFLPTVYAGDQLKNYQYDTIPTEVLQDWKLVKDFGLFESFEIRTPELRKQDPILIGVRQGVRYLIARWAESLAPFEEIRQKAEKALGLVRERIASYEAAISEHNRSFPHIMGHLFCSCFGGDGPLVPGFHAIRSAKFGLNDFRSEIENAQIILARELK